MSTVGKSVYSQIEHSECFMRFNVKSVVVVEGSCLCGLHTALRNESDDDSVFFTVFLLLV